MSRAAFDRLAASVTREYRAKGFSAARAKYIGRATAGKVARLKRRRRRRARKRS